MSNEVIPFRRMDPKCVFQRTPSEVRRPWAHLHLSSNRISGHLWGGLLHVYCWLDLNYSGFNHPLAPFMLPQCILNACLSQHELFVSLSSRTSPQTAIVFDAFGTGIVNLGVLKILFLKNSINLVLLNPCNMLSVMGNSEVTLFKIARPCCLARSANGGVGRDPWVHRARPPRSDPPTHSCDSAADCPIPTPSSHTGTRPHWPHGSMGRPRHSWGLLRTPQGHRLCPGPCPALVVLLRWAARLHHYPYFL